MRTGVLEMVLGRQFLMEALPFRVLDRAHRRLLARHRLRRGSGDRAVEEMNRHARQSSRGSTGTSEQRSKTCPARLYPLRVRGPGFLPGASRAKRRWSIPWSERTSRANSGTAGIRSGPFSPIDDLGQGQTAERGAAFPAPPIRVVGRSRLRCPTPPPSTVVHRALH